MTLYLLFLPLYLLQINYLVRRVTVLCKIVHTVNFQFYLYTYMFFQYDFVSFLNYTFPILWECCAINCVIGELSLSGGEGGGTPKPVLLNVYRTTLNMPQGQDSCFILTSELPRQRFGQW